MTVECECPSGPVGEDTGTTCGCCGEASTIFFDVFYLCERCRAARGVSFEDCERIHEPLNRTYRFARHADGVVTVSVHRPGQESYGLRDMKEPYDYGLVTKGAEALARDVLADVVRDPPAEAVEAFLQEIIAKTEGKAVEMQADFVVGWFDSFKQR